MEIRYKGKRVLPDTHELGNNDINQSGVKIDKLQDQLISARELLNQWVSIQEGRYDPTALGFLRRLACRTKEWLVRNGD